MESFKIQVQEYNLLHLFGDMTNSSVLSDTFLCGKICQIVDWLLSIYLSQPTLKLFHRAYKGLPKFVPDINNAGAIVIMPPRKTKDCQFTEEENQYGYEVACVRVHVCIMCNSVTVTFMYSSNHTKMLDLKTLTLNAFFRYNFLDNNVAGGLL